ncbi:hypothetical protein BO79DRAFT_133622 [Aspergillus costaricaensis CBS 115574]|uniref:Uncharacterized protein n=1 Tax=Aspergillus costaricaensis CBS 115574 TaxID=1448317 RepID=A0ACD1IVV7_9EURO|nr:hypothetical protein BO79DRAFT_133622 [Aspergillus costaricaensis CBS 115574]RAK94409.1 hypothetical protein BO79DRAFT_133622 [Aspergillus costaricaensis CBS 115574]
MASLQVSGSINQRYYEIVSYIRPLMLAMDNNLRCRSASFATATAPVLCTAYTACRHDADRCLTRKNSAPHTSVAQPSASSLLHPDPNILAAIRRCGALIPYVLNVCRKKGEIDAIVWHYQLYARRETRIQSGPGAAPGRSAGLVGTVQAVGVVRKHETRRAYDLLQLLPGLAAVRSFPRGQPETVSEKRGMDPVSGKAPSRPDG